ncbi:hypothetical protein [Tortoise microvirus 37]|nr:hypothetical protein [Tortoise microvirus 37]
MEAVSPPPLPKKALTHADAAAGLSDTVYIASADYRRLAIRTPREGAEPDIVRFYLAFQKDLVARGFPFFATEFLRGRDRQQALYNAGNSKAVFGRSPHNFGMAVDIVHCKRLWDLKPQEWALIGLLGKEAARKQSIKIEWGGDWFGRGKRRTSPGQVGWDPAHWELADWAKRIRGL